jgi:hypothetical protein
LPFSYSTTVSRAEDARPVLTLKAVEFVVSTLDIDAVESADDMLAARSQF